MKKKLAIFNLMARHSLPGVMMVLAALVIADCAVFLTQLDPDYASLYRQFDQIPMYLVCAIGFVSLTLVLCFPMRDRGGRQNYFLHRLNLQPRSIYLSHALYNTLCYILFYAVQALTLVGLCAVVQRMHPDRFTHQTIFITTYQSGLIHSFLPLGDWLLSVSNLVMIAMLGICTAALPTRNRSRKMSITTFVAAILALGVVYLQTIDAGALDITTRIIALFCSVWCVLVSAAGVWDLGVDENA